MLANIFQPLINVNEAILRFFHDQLSFSWGLAIIGLTVVIRLAILPLTFKQVRSMQALQRLQPEIKKLQARYKDDKQRMQQEMMKFYQENSVNPLGSCLPLLLQLPFFMSLFYLQRSEGFKVEVRDTGAAIGHFFGGNPAAAHSVGGGEKFLFISDITSRATGGTLIALIVIYVLTQLGSSHVSAMVATDKNQKRLLYVLPFLFVAFIINFPAGLLVYWITTNSWTIAQQLVIRKVMPPPHLATATAGGDGKGTGGKLKPAPAGAAALTDGKGGGRSATATKPRRGSDKPGDGKAEKTAKPKRDGGGRSSGAAAKTKGDAGAAKSKGSSNGGNGRPEKAPPSSPRKKKKRSGRRR
ncbi:MAG: YidC/Oxa1 family rane protein insertase [Thermoleophilaceae bacterium]|jgi:YidC/Oxa1 family membrane protein insertase|nr:YidC/Oxa1 family rane protein insertase [Thermoleophilaceae bacterium]